MPSRMFACNRVFISVSHRAFLVALGGNWAVTALRWKLGLAADLWLGGAEELGELVELPEGVFKRDSEIISSAGGPLLGVFNRIRSAPAGDDDFLVVEAAAKAFAEMPSVGQTARGKRGDENDGGVTLRDVLEHFRDKI